MGMQYTCYQKYRQKVTPITLNIGRKVKPGPTWRLSRITMPRRYIINAIAYGLH